MHFKRVSYWDKFRCDNTQTIVIPLQISIKYRFHFNQQEEKSTPSCTWTQFHCSLDTKNVIEKRISLQQHEIHSFPTDKILLFHSYFPQRKIIWLSKRILCLYSTHNVNIVDEFLIELNVSPDLISLKWIKRSNGPRSNMKMSLFLSSICLSDINVKLCILFKALSMKSSQDRGFFYQTNICRKYQWRSK